MITFVRAYLVRRAQRRAEAQALRNAEHAAAIRIEHEHVRQHSNVRASLPSQQLAAEIEEIRTGKVSAAFTRKLAARGRR